MERWFPAQDLDPRTIESYRSRLRCHILPKFGTGVAVEVGLGGESEYKVIVRR
ncbi:hypothetical protein [Amycolatopsis sp. NBC_01307]|uniref:hypothetical protein n=1 Tax=Amycolatopsis sp. NBC_01307 TaxID=2903561 RepID=UPI003FA345DA